MTTVLREASWNTTRANDRDRERDQSNGHEQSLTITGVKKIILIFITAFSAVLTSCGGKEVKSVGGTKPETAVAVEQIATVEKRTGSSGTVELLVPGESVFSRGPLSGVYVVGSDGRIAVRWISRGHEDNGRLIVLGGLDAGERIVGKYTTRLEEGMVVKEQVSETKEVQSHE